METELRSSFNCKYLYLSLLADRCNFNQCIQIIISIYNNIYSGYIYFFLQDFFLDTFGYMGNENPFPDPVTSEMQEQNTTSLAASEHQPNVTVTATVLKWHLEG